MVQDDLLEPFYQMPMLLKFRMRIRFIMKLVYAIKCLIPSNYPYASYLNNKMGLGFEVSSARILRFRVQECLRAL